MQNKTFNVDDVLVSKHDKPMKGAFISHKVQNF